MQYAEWDGTEHPKISQGLHWAKFIKKTIGLGTEIHENEYPTSAIYGWGPCCSWRAGQTGQSLEPEWNSNTIHTLKTLVLLTNKFVFSRIQCFCHIWTTHVCVDLTQVLMLEMTTQVLCGTCSSTPKISLPPAKGELTIPCITGGCPIHWANTDTS